MRTANSYLLCTPQQIVTTDVNCDTVGLVYPQFSSTAVEPFSPHVVGSFSPLEFDAPVYDQIHQEQIVAGYIYMTLNIVEPAVQEQVIVHEIPQDSIVERMQAPQVVDSFLLLEDFAATVLPKIILQEIPQIQVVERIQDQSAVTDIVEVVDSLCLGRGSHTC